MGKIWAIIFGVLMFASGICCSTRHFATTVSSNQKFPTYEVVISMQGFGSYIDKVMQVFSSNGLLITSMQEMQVVNDLQEVRISIRNGNTRQFNELENELKNVMNVRSVLIRRI